MTVKQRELSFSLVRKENRQTDKERQNTAFLAHQNPALHHIDV